MLNLILAIASSALVSISMRLSGSRAKSGPGMLCVNYLMCLALAWADSGFVTPLPAEPGLGLTVALGLVNGLLYLAGFLLLQVNIRKNGVVLSATFQRLGLLVSMLVSVVLFREMPERMQWLGFALAVAAIVLINYQPGGEKAGSRLLLILALFTGGITDAMSKVYTQVGNPALSQHFLLYTFVAATAACAFLALREGKGWPGKWEWIWGIVIGVPNFCSAKFLLGALEDLAAVIVYPVHSVATILTVTLVGVLAFREKLEKRQWVALAMILGALALLNL